MRRVFFNFKILINSPRAAFCSFWDVAFDVIEDTSGALTIFSHFNEPLNPDQDGFQFFAASRMAAKVSFTDWTST